MEIIMLIVADLALGAIAWRLGKKNEQSNKNMEAAVKEIREAVGEMKKMNELVVSKVDTLEKRIEKLEAA